MIAATARATPRYGREMNWPLALLNGALAAVLLVSVAGLRAAVAGPPAKRALQWERLEPRARAGAVAGAIAFIAIGTYNVVGPGQDRAERLAGAMLLAVLLCQGAAAAVGRARAKKGPSRESG